MTKISALETAGQADRCEKPVPKPFGLPAASADDWKDMIARTIKSSLQESHPVSYSFFPSDRSLPLLPGQHVMAQTLITRFDGLPHRMNELAATSPRKLARSKRNSKTERASAIVGTRMRECRV